MTTAEATATPRKHRTGAGARFNADHIGIYRAVNAGVLIAALAAILISWNGLTYVGQWVLLPPYMTWLVPVMIDVPIVVFTLATLARRSRGESVLLIAFAAYLLTGVSALANFLHVAAESPMNEIPGIVGASIAALAPMLVLLTTEALGTLITKPPAENSPRARHRRTAEELKAAQKELRALNKALTAERSARVAAEETLARTPTPAAPAPAPAETVEEALEKEILERHEFQPTPVAWAPMPVRD